jgi:hypothetical protein
MMSGLAGGLLDSVFDMLRGVARLGNTYKTRSLSEISQVARVEPLTVISRDLMTTDELVDINQSLLSIFTGYYLQAIALSTKIEGVKVVRVLDRLNPDRQFNDLMLVNEGYEDRLHLSRESFAYCLPKDDCVSTSNTIGRMKLRVATEFIGELYNVMDKTNTNTEDENKTIDDAGGSIDRDGRASIVEQSNLSVGKIVNVTIRVGESAAVIPISFRLNSTFLPDSSIIHLLAMKTEDNTLTERYHSWRSGRITLIKDLILCQDLITEHKKALMDDTDGVYSEIIKRANNTKKYGILSNNPSLVSASNIFVISTDVAKELENKLGGKLSSVSVRDRAFANTYAMILCIVDKEWGRATFYTRGISSGTDVSFKEIKAANKNKGIDPADMMKTMMAGNPVSF